MDNLQKRQAREIAFIKLTAREMLADNESAENIARMIGSEQFRLSLEYGINDALFSIGHDSSGIDIINPYISSCGRFDYTRSESIAEYSAEFVEQWERGAMVFYA